MDYIGNDTHMTQKEENVTNKFDDMALLKHKVYKKARQMIYNITGSVVVFFTFVLTMGNVQLVTAWDWANLTTMLLLMWASNYIMYTNYLQAGASTGRKKEEYIESSRRCNELQMRIIKDGKCGDLEKWCASYSQEELISARQTVLSCVNIPYDVYVEKYLAQPARKILKLQSITQAQKIAIINANRLSPIRINAERLIFSQGINEKRNRGLGAEPKRKVVQKSGTRTLTSIVISSVVVCLNPMADTFVISWESFLTACISVLPILWSAVSGYKAGYTIYADYAVDLFELKSRYIELFTAEDLKNQEKNKEVCQPCANDLSNVA